MFWRAVTPYGFTYMANCDRMGRIDPKQTEKLQEQVRRRTCARRACVRVYV